MLGSVDLTCLGWPAGADLGSKGLVRAGVGVVLQAAVDLAVVVDAVDGRATPCTVMTLSNIIDHMTISLSAAMLGIVVRTWGVGAACSRS